MRRVASLWKNILGVGNNIRRRGTRKEGNRGFEGERGEDVKIFRLRC